MRITNSMMVSQFLYDTNGSVNRLSKYQSQVTSTKRITNISDDPLATITALRARNKLSNLTYYQSNISTAGSYLKEAESSVSELNEIVKTAYEQVVSAMSGSKTQDELNIIAEELENLKNELLGIGNATIGNTYIFGGYNFTGSTDGNSRVAPFSVDNVTGRLFYNKIDISKFAWKEEFENFTELMQKSAENVLNFAAELDGSPTDYYAKETICRNINNVLSQIVDCGKNALYAARQFGLDLPEDNELSKVLDSISTALKKLENERSKKLNDGSGSDPENCFSISAYKNCLTDAINILNNKDMEGNPVESQLQQAINTVADEIVIDNDTRNNLESEKAKRAQLQIGVSQTVEFTLNGLDLMGTGKDNIYHILDKCVKMLKGQMEPDGLKSMITTLQKKQSDILNLQTQIGTIQNKLELIGSRYSASEINYTEMRSEAEDADMAEAIMNFTTAKTVYSSALASGAKMLQISLIDFLR